MAARLARDTFRSLFCTNNSGLYEIYEKIFFMFLIMKIIFLIYIIFGEFGG